MMSGYGFGGGFGMGLWRILVFALLIGVAAVALRRTGGDKSAAAESARDVLDKRYARGEIGREEYEQKKRDLAA